MCIQYHSTVLYEGLNWTNVAVIDDILLENLKQYQRSYAVEENFNCLKKTTTKRIQLNTFLDFLHPKVVQNQCNDK